MTTVRYGYRRMAYHYEMDTVALDASGNGTLAITFDVAYANIPDMKVTGPLACNGTFSAASVTTTGFTLTVAGATDLLSSNIELIWWAHQKP